MSTAIVVLVTTPTAEKAAEIARTLVDERLAACGNILPGVRSIYRWEGKIFDEAEALVIFKTEAALFEALRRRVVELHPYEVPEVISVRVDEGNAAYLQWMKDSVREG